MKHFIDSKRLRGFSLVEVMVSVVIGLLAMTFAARLVLTGERNKDAALGGSDAMQNGMLALLSITADANQAGFGLNDPLLVGCNTRMTDINGFQLATATRSGATITPLAAAIIENNAGGSDRLSLYSGSSTTGTGSLKIAENLTGAELAITVASVPFGFALGDVIVAAPDIPANGNRCSLSQIAIDPAAQSPDAIPQRLEISGAGRFAGNLGGIPFTRNGSRVFNLGPAQTLSLHTWSVVDGVLRLRASDMAGASQNSTAVVDNVVALKAQYGFDTRVGAAFNLTNGLQLSSWSSVMIDADNDGVTGSVGDYQRLAALRVAVVARNENPDKPTGPANTCDTTTAAPQVFNSNVPQNIIAVPVTTNVAIAGDAVSWTCYRYRVFETIVPLRNSAWRPN